eukprot:6064215-Amphidinium_carterae.1
MLLNAHGGNDQVYQVNNLELQIAAPTVEPMHTVARQASRATRAGASAQWPLPDHWGHVPRTWLHIIPSRLSKDKGGWTSRSQQLACCAPSLTVTMYTRLSPAKPNECGPHGRYLSCAS